MAEKQIDALAEILFAGEERADDVKIMPGTDANASPDKVAGELWSSMERVGLIKDGQLVNYNS